MEWSEHLAGVLGNDRLWVSGQSGCSETGRQSGLGVGIGQGQGF